VAVVLTTELSPLAVRLEASRCSMAEHASKTSEVAVEVEPAMA